MWARVSYGDSTQLKGLFVQRTCIICMINELFLFILIMGGPLFYGGDAAYLSRTVSEPYLKIHGAPIAPRSTCF